MTARDMTGTLRALLELLPLERLPRTGWVQRGLSPVEPIAGHVLSTAWIVLALGPRVEPALALDRAVSLALLHDLPEAATGDLPRGAARHLPAGAKREMERGAAEELLSGLSPEALERWREYAAAETREARFVRLCDKLQLGLRLLAYERAGARGLEEFRGSLEALDASEFAPAVELRAALLAALDEPREGRA